MIDPDEEIDNPYYTDVVDAECSADECDHRIVARVPHHNNQISRFVECAECGHHNYMTHPNDFVDRDEIMQVGQWGDGE